MPDFYGDTTCGPSQFDSCLHEWKPVKKIGKRAAALVSDWDCFEATKCLYCKTLRLVKGVSPALAEPE